MKSPVIREIEVKSVITKSNLPVCEYSVNPYVGCTHGCKYCYASFMKRFTGHAEPWGDFLDVKRWPEMKSSKKYDGKELFIGSVTDPYLPQEETHKRTRALLTQLQGSGAKISIATKSDLVLRDLDLIKTFPDARVSWSINTLDEAFQRDMDGAVSIKRRFAAMKAFHGAGVRTTCFISPIFPGITDVKAIVDRAKAQCNLIWLENLNLRGSCKAVIMDYIQEEYPELFPLYQDIYTRNDRGYWETLDAELKTYAAGIGLDYVTNDDSMTRPFDAPPVVVNYFYHEQIRKSARREDEHHAGTAGSGSRKFRSALHPSLTLNFFVRKPVQKIFCKSASSVHFSLVRMLCATLERQVLRPPDVRMPLAVKWRAINAGDFPLQKHAVNLPHGLLHHIIESIALEAPVMPLSAYDTAAYSHSGFLLIHQAVGHSGGPLEFPIRPGQPRSDLEILWISNLAGERNAGLRRLAFLRQMHDLVAKAQL